MANAMFFVSAPVEEKPIVPSRRGSRAASISSAGNQARSGSFTQSHVSPLVHAPFMAEAIAEARAGLAEGGIPIGCVLVRRDQVVARGHNRRVQRNSVVLHAEMDCLEACGRQPASFYRDCTIYTTLSPCSMCSGAIRLYGISLVVVGENRTFMGDEALLRASNVQVDVLDSQECQDLMADFIKKNPTLWHEDIAQN